MNILHAYKDHRNPIRPNAKEVSQIENLLRPVYNNMYYENRNIILGMISNHDSDKFSSSRKQEIEKGATKSVLHDNIFEKLKQNYPNAIREAWLEKAASSVDIFISGKFIDCNKDIVIQVDGGSHYYTSDKTITAKTIHNTKDL